MEIGVKEAAALLKVSEKTIYRWVSSKKIPFYRVGSQYRFSRAELLRWAAGETEPGPRPSPSPEVPEPIRLETGLRRGGIFYRVGGDDVLGVLEEITALMKLPDGVDPLYVVERLYERERLSTTGLGGGIAFPHCRDISLPGLPHPIVSLSFLEKPVDFQAIDGKPVKVVFTLLSASAPSSIRLMSRLAYAVRKPEILRLLDEEASREEILRAAAAVDAELDRP